MVSYKKVLMLFVLLGMSVSAGALTLNPGTLDANDGDLLSGGYTFNVNSGAFTKRINFSVLNAPVEGITGSFNVISVLISNGVSSLDVKAKRNTGDGFKFFDITLVETIDITGIAYGLVYTGNFLNGDYKFILEGDALPQGATLSGNAAISAVPIPAALWLFGTGLLGVFGVNRRFKGNV